MRNCIAVAEQCNNDIVSVEDSVDHVNELKKIINLYLEDEKDRQNLTLVIRRLKRYCKMKDLSGLNNMFLTAQSDEVKKLYGDFQKLDGFEKMHLLKEFEAAINDLVAHYGNI